MVQKPVKMVRTGVKIVQKPVIFSFRGDKRRFYAEKQAFYLFLS